MAGGGGGAGGPCNEVSAGAQPRVQRAGLWELALRLNELLFQCPLIRAGFFVGCFLTEPHK